MTEMLILLLPGALNPTGFTMALALLKNNIGVAFDKTNDNSNVALDKPLTTYVLGWKIFSTYEKMLTLTQLKLPNGN